MAGRGCGARSGVLSTTAVLRDLQNLTSLTWDTTASVSNDSPTSRDVTTASRDVTPLLFSDSKGRSQKICNVDVDFFKPGLPSHCSTPAISDFSKRKMRRKTPRKSDRRKSSSTTLFFAAEEDIFDSGIKKEQKPACQNDVCPLERSKKSAEPVGVKCNRTRNTKTVSSPRNNSKRSLLNSVGNASTSLRRSRYFFIEEGDVDEDMWDPTPSLSSLSQFIKTSKTPVKSPVGLTSSGCVTSSNNCSMSCDEDLWDPTPSLPSHSQFIKTSKTPVKSHVGLTASGCMTSSNNRSMSCDRKSSKNCAVSRSESYMSPVKLFFCDPGDVCFSPFSSFEKMEDDSKTGILSSCIVPSFSSCDVKSEMKVEECKHNVISIKTEPTNFQHIVGKLRGRST